MSGQGEELIAQAVDLAEEVSDAAVDVVDAQKPRLLVDRVNPDRTVAALRGVLARANSANIYERGTPVRLHYDQMQGGHVAQRLNADGIVLVAHQVCRPYERKLVSGAMVERDARLPIDIAKMYLAWHGEWSLPALNGVASCPLLKNDGTISSSVGYDAASGMWCENMPDLSGLIPDRTSADQAAAALRLIRYRFKTFCFSDAEMIYDDAIKAMVVDVDKPPGKDESAFLTALLTAVCRPSLHLAPGVLFRAAPMSGAGAGKGLLVRCICIIAFGREPHAVTAGSNAEELEKRMVAELIQGSPALFIDNLNNVGLKSDLLASAITERPARVRVLGKSQMMPLNASAFVALTGNGLTVSEDLARRFIAVELDPRTEDPEAREFPDDIRIDVTSRRRELLAAALTIWRWGRLTNLAIKGATLGSFEQWGCWVRDPLLALGCVDPAERVREAKQRDRRRDEAAEILSTWWDAHQDRAVAANDLDSMVKKLLDPHDRGRQYIVARLEALTGTRIAGFIFTAQKGNGKWSRTTYAVNTTDDGHRHRGHREHGATSIGWGEPDAPYAPYAVVDEADTMTAPVLPPIAEHTVTADVKISLQSDVAPDFSGWQERV
jgi:hypothetical protein